LILKADITDANANEKDNLRKSLKPDKFYVLDAGYGQYSLLEDIIKVKSSFVARLRDNAVWETIKERP
jgi:hypothetical protein